MEVIFFIGGIFCILMGIIGMHQGPSFYSRVMASTLIDTAGYLCILIGLMIHMGWKSTMLKLGVLAFVVIIINPILTHFMILASWKSGHKEDVKEEDYE